MIASMVRHTEIAKAGEDFKSLYTLYTMSNKILKDITSLWEIMSIDLFQSMVYHGQF